MELARPGGCLAGHGSLTVCLFGNKFLLRWLPTVHRRAGFQLLLAPTTAAPPPGWPSTRIDWSDRHGSRVIQNTQSALVPRLMCNLVFCCRSAMTHGPSSSIMREARRVERQRRGNKVGFSFGKAHLSQVCSSVRIFVRGRRQATLRAIWINSASTEVLSSVVYSRRRDLEAGEPGQEVGEWQSAVSVPVWCHWGVAPLCPTLQ
jgi:hypothetical protein